MTIYKEFCVYLTKYAGNKLPPLYIGSRATIDETKKRIGEARKLAWAKKNAKLLLVIENGKVVLNAS